MMKTIILLDGALRYIRFITQTKLICCIGQKDMQITSHLGWARDYVFSPGDIVLTRGSTDISKLKLFSNKEEQTLFESCIRNGVFWKRWVSTRM